MSRIIVTGGAGFIGSVLIKRLFGEFQDKFDELVVIDKLTYAGNVRNLGEVVDSPKFSLSQSDISNFAEVASLIQDGDIVFHLAAESHVDNSISSGAIFWETNAIGTANILETIKSRKDVRLLYVSTDEVYGSTEIGSFTEESPLNPTSPYSASKAAGDLACLAYMRTHGINLNITRCSNNFGVEQHPEKLLPVLVNNTLNGNPVPIYGDGKNVREWIPAWVHSEYLIRIMFSDVSGEVFNIGSGFEMSNLETADFVAKTLNRELKIDFVEDRKAHDFRYSIDCKKVMNRFGLVNYDPKAELAKTIKQCAGII